MGRRSKTASGRFAFYAFLFLAAKTEHARCDPRISPARGRSLCQVRHMTDFCMIHQLYRTLFCTKFSENQRKSTKMGGVRDLGSWHNCRARGSSSVCQTDRAVARRLAESSCLVATLGGSANIAIGAWTPKPRQRRHTWFSSSFSKLLGNMVNLRVKRLRTPGRRKHSMPVRLLCYVSLQGIDYVESGSRVRPS